MKQIIILLAVCLLGTIAYTQNDNIEDSVEIISINGLELGGVYTREEIFAALGGQPDEIYHDEEFPDFYNYIYGQDVFTQRDNQFYGGEISSSRFYISKGIRVGDSIESINKLNGICTSGEYDKSIYEGGVRWMTKNKESWDWQKVIFYYDSQGKIAGINIYVFYQ